MTTNNDDKIPAAKEYLKDSIKDARRMNEKAKTDPSEHRQTMKGEALRNVLDAKQKLEEALSQDEPQWE